MKTSQAWDGHWQNEALRIWRLIVPFPQDRIPVTVHTVHNIFLPLVPLLFMAYLVRRPNTYLLRLALMPITIWTVLRASFGYVWVEEKFSPYNFGQGEYSASQFWWFTPCLGLFGLASIGKALEYGLVRAGRFKLGEAYLGEITTPAIDRETSNKPSSYSNLGRKGSFSNASSATSLHAASPPSKITKSPSGVNLGTEKSVANGLDKRKTLRSPSGVAIGFKDASSAASAASLDVAANKAASPFRGLSDAIEVVGSVRGIGWDWGKGLYVAAETRPLDRPSFIKATAISFVLSFISLDVIESSLKLLPPFRAAKGGSVFFFDVTTSFLADNALLSPFIKAFPELSTLVFKYAVSTVISFFVGLAIIAGFQMCYTLLTLFCVGLLKHNTESWPPIFDRPWAATSLADFWGKRWHQTLRETFFIFGGYPFQFISENIARLFLAKKKAENVGRVGLVLGTFVASGFFHGLAIYAMGDGGVDFTAPLYFSTQGVMLIMERVWRMVTGKRVGGLWGRLWSWTVVIIGIEFCIDVWTSRGLASGLIIPPFCSPSRLIIFPTLIRLLER